MTADDDDVEVWRLSGLPSEPVSAEAIQAAAIKVIDLFPDEPELAACQRADKALEEGDVTGAAFWTQVAKAVGDLVRIRPAGQPLN